MLPVMRVLLDMNCANVEGAIPDLNIIESWGTEGRIDLRVAVAFEREARQWRGPRGASAQEKACALRPIPQPMVYDLQGENSGGALDSDDCYYDDRRGPWFDDIARILFPSTEPQALTGNQEQDVLHLLTAESARGFFITNDSDIVGPHKPQALAQLGINVLRPAAFVGQMRAAHGWGASPDDPRSDPLSSRS
jgi:hypothetical protein